MSKRNIIFILLLLLQIQQSTFAQDSYTQFINKWDKQLSEFSNEYFNLLMGDTQVLLIESTKPYRGKDLIYKQALLGLADYCKDILLPDISYVLAVRSFGDNLDYFHNDKRLSNLSKAEFTEYVKYIGDVTTITAEMEECFNNEGKVQTIEKYYKIAIDYYSTLEEFAKEQVETIDKLACFYMRIGEYKKALKTFQEEILNNQETKALSAEKLMMIENKMAYCYLMTKQAAKAGNILKQLTQVQQVPYSSMTYALIIHNAANLSIMKNDTTQALSQIRQAMKIYDRRVPSWEEIAKNYMLPESFTLLRHSALLFQQQKMPQQASFIYEYINSMLIGISEKSLFYLGEDYILWNAIRPLMNEMFLFAYQSGNGKLMSDTSNIYKAFFYTYFSSQHQSDIYNDAFLKGLIEQMNLLLQMSFNTNDYLDDNKFWPTMKWRIRRNNLANFLANYCKKNKLANYQVTGERTDLSKILSDDEAVIEFVSFHDSKKEETLCCAVVFNKANQSSNIIPLCSKEELDCMLQKPPREQLVALSNSFWKPIEKSLKGHKRLYLSISDEFSNIPFAGIKIEEQYLPDKYKLYTISHASNIYNIKIKKELPINDIPSIFLFGGADFGLPPSQAGNQTRGQGFTYLPGSKQEVDLIAQLCKEKSKSVTSFTGALATKKNLESLSYRQQSPSILHISTHGFFVPFINEDDKNKTQEVTNAYNRFSQVLKRCGLVLTGANKAWTNKDSVDCQSNNGVITSLELSTINLSATELVVLSACHSAKEESPSHEVTSGLKRALSLAGAHSLLAALWAIPDKESVEMMTEFYTQWLSGLSKRDAFDIALQKMRKSYPDAPEKWAAFTLME